MIQDELVPTGITMSVANRNDYLYNLLFIL